MAAMQPRNAGDTSSTCFNESTAALQECNDKTVAGNAGCANIMNVAESEAGAKLKSDVAVLNNDSQGIQSNLEDCKKFEDDYEAALCYMERVSCSTQKKSLIYLINFTGTKQRKSSQ